MSNAVLKLDRRRVSVSVTGVVQGVGFRPFVYRLATELDLDGWVANGSDGVSIELTGPSASVDECLDRLVSQRPPLATIESVTVTELGLPLASRHGFHIHHSQLTEGLKAFVPPDVATCIDCLGEMNDPTNRRFGHPLINCTNCGPRFTIVEGVPYDRASTTMSRFLMCEHCQNEYDDPRDRRYHAEPIGCCDCGPRLRFVSFSDSGEQVVEGDSAAILACLKALAAGMIVAIKGIGGYHLAVDATNEGAVSRLRQRKHRDEKPFAVLVANEELAYQLIVLSNESRVAISGAAAPILIADKRQANTNYNVTEGVAPSNSCLGVMLPASGLQYLLAERFGRPLVMTSGNQVSEPIVHRDGEAIDRLSGIADAFLTHDRDIYRSADDSVVRSSSLGGTSTVRRGRGFAPKTFRQSSDSNALAVLGVGAELKNTVCLSRENEAIVSPHLGDLENVETYRSFTNAISDLESMAGVRPALIAHDMHPEYFSTKWALEQDVDVLAVQHHHAHIGSCLAEHGLSDRVVGLAFDGHGYGPDETLWGGECLVADLCDFERVGHLETISLPGGAIAIREPWRMAAAYLSRAYDGDVPQYLGVLRRNEAKWADVATLSTLPITMKTSSMGRLFDAIAAILNLGDRSSFEGQTAMKCEQAASRTAKYSQKPGRLAIIEIDSDLPIMRMQPDSFLRSIVEHQRRGVGADELAWGAHRCIADASVEMVEEACRRVGLNVVALSGGVFQNVLLSEMIASTLTGRGFRVLTHSQVPCNDGGISLGQVAIGRATLSVRRS